MARPLRLEFPGALYHVSSRGNSGAAIFLDDRDRSTFLDLLGGVVERYGWVCQAYCLMGNHYHLLIETPRGNLSLAELFPERLRKDKRLRDRAIRSAVRRWGYGLSVVARELGLHYSTVSRVISGER